ncbi:MAG: hypothetical protein CMJ80_14935 [Planctomycetaceae bacterium]|nr:hypothetical protein [Planctomycetaceae bacterium]
MITLKPNEQKSSARINQRKSMNIGKHWFSYTADDAATNKVTRPSTTQNSINFTDSSSICRYQQT